MELLADNKKPPRLVLIAAMSRNRVISAKGKIPWHLPRDTAHFRARAAGHWLLLGRRTYEQMRGWFQLGHVPVVLTSNADTLCVPGGFACGSLNEAIALAETHAVPELLVCGGGTVYAAALPLADEVILTTVDAEFEGDTFFPELPAAEWKVDSELSSPADEKSRLGIRITSWRRVLAADFGLRKLPES